MKKSKKSLLVFDSLLSSARSIGVGFVVAGVVPLAFSADGAFVAGQASAPICILLAASGIVVIFGGSYNFERMN